MESKRIAETFAGKEDKVNWGHLDFSEVWDKWTGQHDPFMSAVETWHAGAAPWRNFVDTKARRMRSRSCMTKLDFNYGYVDLARIAEDSDGTHVPDTYQGPRAFLGECVLGAAARFFYNTRVFWNDGDNFHVYRYAPPDPSAPPTEPRRIVPYNEAKVMANYKAIATSCVMPSEAFDTEYPEDRIELLKRVAPPTADAAYPVDLFERKPAAVWNMPVERPFGKWSVLAVFNFGVGMRGADLRVTLDAEKDLRLDPAKEYVAYEFWSRKLAGTFKGKFTSRAIKRKDCDIYSIVEKQDRPVLLSTSRHVRQMAFDVRRLAWDAGQNRMSGVSRAVGGDPYQLRIYVPAGYRFDRVELPSNLSAKPVMDGNLLTVDYTTLTGDDVAWNISFSRVRQ